MSAAEDSPSQISRKQHRRQNSDADINIHRAASLELTQDNPQSTLRSEIEREERKEMDDHVITNIEIEEKNPTTRDKLGSDSAFELSGASEALEISNMSNMSRTSDLSNFSTGSASSLQQIHTHEQHSMFYTLSQMKKQPPLEEETAQHKKPRPDEEDSEHRDKILLKNPWKLKVRIEKMESDNDNSNSLLQGHNSEIKRSKTSKTQKRTQKLSRPHQSKKQTLSGDDLSSQPAEKNCQKTDFIRLFIDQLFSWQPNQNQDEGSNVGSNVNSSLCSNESQNVSYLENSPLTGSLLASQPPHSGSKHLKLKPQSHLSLQLPILSPSQVGFLSNHSSFQVGEKKVGSSLHFELPDLPQPEIHGLITQNTHLHLGGQNLEGSGTVSTKSSRSTMTTKSSNSPKKRHKSFFRKKKCSKNDPTSFTPIVKSHTNNNYVCLQSLNSGSYFGDSSNICSSTSCFSSSSHSIQSSKNVSSTQTKEVHNTHQHRHEPQTKEKIQGEEEQDDFTHIVSQKLNRREQRYYHCLFSPSRSIDDSLERIQLTLQKMSQVDQNARNYLPAPPQNRQAFHFTPSQPTPSEDYEINERKTLDSRLKKRVSYGTTPSEATYYFNKQVAQDNNPIEVDLHRLSTGFLDSHQTTISSGLQSSMCFNHSLGSTSSISMGPNGPTSLASVASGVSGESVASVASLGSLEPSVQNRWNATTNFHSSSPLVAVDWVEDIDSEEPDQFGREFFESFLTTTSTVSALSFKSVSSFKTEGKERDKEKENNPKFVDEDDEISSM